MCDILIESKRCAMSFSKKGIRKNFMINIDLQNTVMLQAHSF